MAHRLPMVAALALLASCGNRALGPEPADGGSGEQHMPSVCGDAGPLYRSPSHDHECTGNVGCSARAYQCGCHCTLCGDGLCLRAICDDSCMPRDWRTDDVRPPVDSRPSMDAVQTCTVPSYPSDCAQVSTFQCGFMATCTDGIVKANWHEHYECNGQEQIASFTCKTTCSNGCAGTTSVWPKDGADLVAQVCN